jgi:hypothetical protein
LGIPRDVCVRGPDFRFQLVPIEINWTRNGHTHLLGYVIWGEVRKTARCAG